MFLSVFMLVFEGVFVLYAFRLIMQRPRKDEKEQRDKGVRRTRYLILNGLSTVLTHHFLNKKLSWLDTYICHLVFVTYSTFR